MSLRVYLLSLTDLKTSGQLEDFLKEAYALVDEVRRGKAQKIRNPRGRAASLGAGLLLQKMAADYQSGAEMQGEQHYTAAELPGLLRTLQHSQRLPLALQYRFGSHGKPEIVDFPLHFSISHSGDYVLCVSSEREVGADIQQLQPVDSRKLAGRFFTEKERTALEECSSEAEKQRLFFRMWAEKEAYGKLTGQGVIAVLNREVRQLGETVECGRGYEDTEWPEIAAPEGYATAVCIGSKSY